MATTYVSIDGWMDKENVTYVQWKVTWPQKKRKKEILPFATTCATFEGGNVKWSQIKTNTIWHHMWKLKTKAKIKALRSRMLGGVSGEWVKVVQSYNYPL